MKEGETVPVEEDEEAPVGETKEEEERVEPKPREETSAGEREVKNTGVDSHPSVTENHRGPVQGVPRTRLEEELD